MFYDDITDIIGRPTPYGKFIYIDAIPPHTPTTYKANMITNPYITNKFTTNDLPTTANVDRSSPDNEPSSQVTPPSNTAHPGSPNNVPLLTQAPDPFPLPTNNVTNINLHDILLKEPLVRSAASSPNPPLCRSGVSAAGDATTNSKTIDLLSKNEEKKQDVCVSDVLIKKEEENEEPAHQTNSTEAAATLVSIKDTHQNGLAVQSAVAPATKPFNSSDQTNNKPCNSSDADKKMPAKGSLATDVKEKEMVTRRSYRKTPSPTKNKSHMQTEKIVTVEVAMPKGVRKRLGPTLYSMDIPAAAGLPAKFSVSKQKRKNRRKQQEDAAALTKKAKVVVEPQCKHCKFPLSSCHDKAFGEYCTFAVVAEFDLCDHEEDLPTKMQSFYTYQRAYSAGAHYETFDLMKIYDENTCYLKPPQCMLENSWVNCKRLLANAKELKDFKYRISNSVHMGYGMRKKLYRLHYHARRQASLKNGEPLSPHDSGSDHDHDEDET